MKWTEGGYTMFEVIIVLAVSSTILISAIGLFNGQNAETGFNQAVHDISSEMSTQIKKVSTSYFPNSEQYQCNVVGGRAVLTPTAEPGGQELGSNEDCIYLGKGIEVVPQTSDFYFYEVLGSRVDASGNIVNTFSAARPEPMVGTNGNPDLTVKYSAGRAIKVVSSTMSTTAVSGASTLAGYYADLAGASTDDQGGRGLLISKGYNYSHGGGPHNNATVGEIIRVQNNPMDIINWDICLHDPNDSRSAILQVISSPSGVITNIKFVSCN